MLWLDITNCLLTALCIIVTSTIVDKMGRKKKVITIAIVIILCISGQIWALIENKNDRQCANEKINRQIGELVTLQNKVDTAIMQRDTTIQLAKKYIDEFLDSLEKHGIHYDREKGIIQIRSQKITVNQAPVIDVNAPVEKLNFNNNKINSNIYIDSKPPKPR